VGLPSHLRTVGRPANTNGFAAANALPKESADSMMDG
jgi:hypothetical protein